MIYENIDKLIAEAMKNHNSVKLSTLRLIKTKFLEYKTSKGAKPIDNLVEITLLKKMVAEREDSYKIYKEAGREELADKEFNEMNIIKEFLPEDISQDKIVETFESILLTGVEPIRKNMGVFIKSIKEKYPTADGKLISTIVSSKLS